MNGRRHLIVLSAGVAIIVGRARQLFPICRALLNTILDFDWTRAILASEP
jgi:hypothetical protein